jgi:hypothetical protein
MNMSSMLFGDFSSKLPQNRHPERSASPIRRDNRVSARSRRTSRMNISSMLFGAFQPRKPAFIKPATVFPWTELECFSSNSHKTVILSEALRKSIANRGLYGAESKDPEDEYVVDAVWRFFFKTPTKSSS